MDKYHRFIRKYMPSVFIENYRKFASKGASLATGALGHGAVATYPDRPFLRGKFTYNSDNKSSGWRNNQQTYIEACEKLYDAFSAFANEAGISQNPVQFSSIKDEIAKILSLEAPKGKRIKAWQNAIQKGMLFANSNNEKLNFDAQKWEAQKDEFRGMNKSSDIITTDIYKYYQAAIYHYDYTLKELFPRYKLAII